MIFLLLPSTFSFTVISCFITCSFEYFDFSHDFARINFLQVSKRYKQYYQQVHAVITSFESVAGLSTAAPYASMALKAMSKHFKCLKSMISNQLRQTNKVLGKEGINKEDISSFGLVSGGICLQRANNMGNFGQPHVWRPQRGLPERAVAVLRAWLFEHFLHP